MLAKKILSVVLLIAAVQLAAQDTPCLETLKNYTTSGGFSPSDFAASGASSTLDIGNTIVADPGGRIDTENIVFPKTQPFVADYLGEGAGASHLFGFFFLDIDSSGNGIPNFFLIGDADDADGDGIANKDDDDDDGDGIPDDSDVGGNGGAPSMARSMPPSFFRNGEAAAAVGAVAGDYWKWVPNDTITYTDDNGNSFSNVFRHPGAYLYVDQYRGDGGSGSDGVPDMLQMRRGINEVPAFALDRNWKTPFIGGGEAPGLLGMWGVNWVGSTIFYLADDDGGTGITSNYTNNTPYGNLYLDKYNKDSQPDYDIYGTTDASSPLIPDLVKANDPEGVPFWRYRWYQSDVSGGREMVFFMVVFWGSGGQSVNTYYSKVAFNPDSVGNPNPSGGANSTGDNYGVRVPDEALGPLTPNNWWPRFQNLSDHNLFTATAFGANTDWYDIVQVGTIPPVAIDSANQEWVDTYQNWDPDSRVIAYRALGDWLNTASPAENRIRGRYNIDLDAERESRIIRAINGQMNHLMVGAPSANPNAWLLGWEDLFGGGDRDYEDIVWYVTREASGSLETNNIAGNLSQFDDVSLTQITFKFTDNFTDDKFFDGTPRSTYINYYYKLAAGDEWIPLIGGEHERTPDLFVSEGETIVNGNKVTRTITINIPPSQAGKREAYWRTDMSTNDPNFKPELFDVEVSYKALVHDFFYENAVIPNSNVDYFGAYETPSISWADRNANRGHFYAMKRFEHGNPPTRIAVNSDPESGGTYEALPEPFMWDAGLSLYNQVAANPSSSGRNIYTFVENNGALERRDFSLLKPLDSDVQAALALDDPEDVGSRVIDGLLQNNFHDPTVNILETPEASTWLAAWVHGYNGATLAGETVLPHSKKEWILGGVKRSSATIVRAPGIPGWFIGNGMEPEDSTFESPIHDSYIDWALNNAELPTRVLFGSESGMVHAVDAGNWRAGRLQSDFVPFDGHYDGDAVGNYSLGTGEEVWAMIPNNLLDDLKFNISGLEPSGTRAVVDTTGIDSVIYVPGMDPEWRRIAVFSQGEKGGLDDGRSGIHVFALDLTDIDNPQPLWEYTQSNFQGLINPVGIGWFQAPTNTDGGWRVAVSSGAVGVAGQKPSMVFLDAYTGAVVDEYVFPSADGATVSGSPALVDFDLDGLIDFAYAGSSDGVVVAYDVNRKTAVVDQVANSGFFLSPNVRVISENEVRVIFVSGDSPLLVDETGNQNSVFTMTHNVPDFEAGDIGGFATLCSSSLPNNHKAFARPRLSGESLVVGTTTGDTNHICDFDPADPGDLILYRDVKNCGQPDNEVAVRNFGSIKAPLVVTETAEIRAHTFVFDSSTSPTNAPWQAGHRTSEDGKGEPQVRTGKVQGITGWQEKDVNN